MSIFYAKNVNEKIKGEENVLERNVFWTPESA